MYKTSALFVALVVWLAIMVPGTVVAQNGRKTPPAGRGETIKTILLVFPWGSIIEAVYRTLDEPRYAESKSVSLNHLEDAAKLIVAEARVTNQVTKWQEEAYGSITMKTDVVSRVTYSIDLKKVRLRWDNDLKAVVLTLPAIEVDGIEYIKWDTNVSFTRVRKWFSSDTRAALEAATRADVKRDARKEAEKYLAQVRMTYLEAIRVAAQKQLQELSPDIKVVFE